MKRTFIWGVLASVLVFGMTVVGCLTTGDPTQNNIGEIIGDNYALVRAPAASLYGSSTSYVLGASGSPAIVIFSGNDLTIWNKYKITRAIMGIGNNTIDLKVTPGNHEFTIVWVQGTQTKITTQNFDFKAGKWYEIKSTSILGMSDAPIAIREGTLTDGKPKGSTEELSTFVIDQIFNSDVVAPEPEQAVFRGSPGNVTAEKPTVIMRDGPQPGQLILALSDGYKFGPGATVPKLLEMWFDYPTYPVTVSPAHCTGSFSSDGTQVLITMKTSNNVTVTRGSVTEKNVKVSISLTGGDDQIFIPRPSASGFPTIRVEGGGSYPSLN